CRILPSSPIEWHLSLWRLRRRCLICRLSWDAIKWYLSLRRLWRRCQPCHHLYRDLTEWYSGLRRPRRRCQACRLSSNLIEGHLSLRRSCRRCRACHLSSNLIEWYYPSLRRWCRQCKTCRHSISDPMISDSTISDPIDRHLNPLSTRRECQACRLSWDAIGRLRARHPSRLTLMHFSTEPALWVSPIWSRWRLRRKRAMPSLRLFWRWHTMPARCSR